MNSENAVTNGNETFAMIPTVLLRNPDVSVNAKILYALLWDRGDRNTRDAIASRTKLAEEMGRSLDTIDRALKELTVIRAVAIRHRYNDDGNQVASSYHLNHWSFIVGGRMGAAGGPQEKETFHKDTAEGEHWDPDHDQTAVESTTHEEIQESESVVRGGAEDFKATKQASRGLENYWTRQQKAKRNGPKFVHSDTKTASRSQLRMLDDLSLILEGTEYEDHDLSSADAHTLIQEYWGYVATTNPRPEDPEVQQIWSQLSRHAQARLLEAESFA